MNKLQRAVCAWHGIIWIGLTLVLELPASAQHAGKTFFTWAGEGVYQKWQITGPETMVKTEIVTDPRMGGIRSPTGEYSLKFRGDGLYLVDSEGKIIQRIPLNPRDVLEIRWDWTGWRFLFRLSDGRGLSVGEILPDKSVRVRRVPEGGENASFSPDRETLIVERWPGLYLLNLANGTERSVSTRVETRWSVTGYAPEWTADGRYVLFVYYEGVYPYSKNPLYRHPFWVLDLAQGTEHHLKFTGRRPLPSITSPLFWSTRGDRAVYWADGLEKSELVILSIKLTSMIINKVQVFKAGEPMEWIERGKLLLVKGPVVVDLTGKRVKVIRPVALPGAGNGAKR